METATRDAHGRFKPGCSGNPAGKQPGTLNHATRLKQWVDDPEADGKLVARALVAQAAKGSVPAIRLWLDRFDPKPRGRAIRLALPEDPMLLERFNAAFDAMAAGEITPDEALTVARALEHQSKAISEREEAKTREIYGMMELEAERREAEVERAEQAAQRAAQDRTHEPANQDDHARDSGHPEATHPDVTPATLDSRLRRDDVQEVDDSVRPGAPGDAAADAQARAHEPANPDRQARDSGHPGATHPDAAPVTLDPRLRGDDVQGVTASIGQDEPPPPAAPEAAAEPARRDPREYALPEPAGSEPKPQHPTCISRGWGGKRRYGERRRRRARAEDPT